MTVSGTIGAGKSTFIQNYAEYLKKNIPSHEIVTHMEPVEHNNLLKLMYEDPRRWNFTSQVNFLMDKVHAFSDFLRYEETHPSARPAVYIVERDFREFLVFMMAHKRTHNITKEEYQLYCTLHEKLEPRLNIPSFCVYLDTDFEESYNRMLKRGRPFEVKRGKSYYKLLHRLYEEYYSFDYYKLSDTYSTEEYQKLTEYLLKVEGGAE